MEITSVPAFLSYYKRTREATDRVISAIPRDNTGYAYMPGKFSIGDIVRHIAAIERNLFAEVVQGRRSGYAGCGSELADGYDNIVSYFNEMHRQSIEIFGALKDEELTDNIVTLNGKETSKGNFLRALIVHEVHHRGALCIYLNLLGVASPPIMGLKEEQVIVLSKPKQP